MSARLILMLVCCASACLTWTGAALAAQGKSGARYQGKTAQKRQISMRVSRNRLDLLHFSIRLRCRDGSVLIDQESGFLPTPLRAGGSFSDVQVGSTDEVWLRGRLRGSTVRGKLRVKDFVKVHAKHSSKRKRVRCDSHWVRFSAKPRR